MVQSNLDFRKDLDFTLNSRDDQIQNLLNYEFQFHVISRFYAMLTNNIVKSRLRCITQVLSCNTSTFTFQRYSTFSDR